LTVPYFRRTAWDVDYPAANPVDPDRLSLKLIACPARSEADELALHMFRQLLEASEPSVQVEVVSVKALVAEVISQIQNQPAAVVCIAALPPGGMAQARYLCKRLRALSPDRRIVFGRWGAPAEQAAEIRDRFRDLRIDHVATSVRESRDQMLPWIRLPPQPAALPESSAPLTPLGVVPGTMASASSAIG